MLEKFNFRSIGSKLVFMITAIALGLIVLMVYVNIKNARKAILEKEIEELKVVETLQANHIKFLTESKFRDINTFVATDKVKQSAKLLNQYNLTKDTNPDGSLNTKSDHFNELYEKLDVYFQGYHGSYYRDIYIVDSATGHVVYSALQNDDMGSDLKRGIYSRTQLGILFNHILQKKKTVLSDFSDFDPAKSRVAFIGSPMMDDKGEFPYVMIMQFGIEEFDMIMHQVDFLGETYESYLLGEDNLMRTNSRFISNSSNSQEIRTKTVLEAQNSTSGSLVCMNYNGKEVLSSHQKMNMKEWFDTEFNWILINEVELTEVMKSTEEMIRNTFILGIVILILAIIFVSIIARMITRPIVKLEEQTKLLAQGDMTGKITIKSHDEIGKLARSFQDMQQNMAKRMKNQVDEITDGVNILASSSSEIMAMVSQLASGSAETATSVSQTTTTIEEVKQTAIVSVQKANEVSESAQKISSISKDGEKSVDETIEGMNRIKKQMEAIARIVIQLSEKSSAIGEIAGNVNDLAEQSNLLAVNASIEAAKAGEHGKGFSVVAQEIKNLASRSKDSTVQINRILSDIQKEISNAVMATEQGVKVIDSGIELSSKSKEVISMLATGIDQSSAANMHISASSQQQLTGMDQITAAMENIKEASLQATEGTKQAEDSIAELKSLGERLLQMLKQYKLN